jgi:hypothetical protein
LSASMCAGIGIAVLATWGLSASIRAGIGIAVLVKCG